MSHFPSNMIDRSHEEEMGAPPASIFGRANAAASKAPVPYTPATGSSQTATSLCPVCQSMIRDEHFDRHVSECLGLESKQFAYAASAASRSAARAPAVVLESQIQQFQSFLATQSPQALSQLAPQLQSLEQQIHSVLVPIATMNGVVNISVPSHPPASSAFLAVSSSSSSPSLDDSTQDVSSGRHVLTTRASVGGAVPAPTLSPTTPSQARPSAVNLTFDSPSASVHQTATAGAVGPSSSAFPPPHNPYAASSSHIPSYPSSDFDADQDLLSDEALVRKLQEEEEQAAVSARRARAEAAEREFAEFMKREGTCSKCARAAPPEELVQICEEQQRGKSGSNNCDHRICTDCLRPYLQHIVQRLTNPNLASPSATTFAAAAARSSKPTSQLTEADLVCPYPNCHTPLAQWQMKRVLSQDDFEMLLSCTLRNMMKDPSKISGGFITCPNPSCNNTFEALPGNGVQPVASLSTELGVDGQPISAASKYHRSLHRFRCHECATIFCGSCSSSPYHEGLDCEQWKRYQQAKKCRFCATGLTPSNTANPPDSSSSSIAAVGSRAAALVGGVVGSLAGFFGALSSSSSSSSSSAAAHSSGSQASPCPPALLDVCNSSDCISKRNQSCERTLPCGHYCGGIRGEQRCLPCLKEDCPAHDASGVAVSEDDYCNICYVEGLGQAPSIQLDCGHLYHTRCIEDKIQRRWPSARISFQFMKCPLCSREISHPSLQALMAPMVRLRAEVCLKATQRLVFEGLENDEAFTSSQGRYYGRKEDYAMDKFAYYMCYKCKQPYFGGQRRCEEAAQAQGEEKFAAEHLVCGGCTAGSDAKTCAKHGKEFVEFKCKFCCNIATWYCWGTTHFCTSCHQRQEGGDYVTRKPITELPKCPGPGLCPLGVKHPLNGHEFSLGCGICRPRDF